MTKEELKNKYSAFISEVSEILGLGKPIDIIKLCATTDLFFQPLEKRIIELEKENADLKTLVAEGDCLMDNCREMSNKIAELKAQIEKVKHYLDYDIPHDLINEATTKIWRMLK